MNERFAIQGYSVTDRIICTISGDDIVQTDFLGNSQIIGKTAAAYAELEAVTTEYYDKLVELGHIIPTKSPEEQMQEMQQNMNNMVDILASLTAEIKELKSHGHNEHNADTEPAVPERRNSGRSAKSAASHNGDT